MPRTEFHSKLERQIQAIESVAKETQGVAAAITDRENRARLAGLVIDLANDLFRLRGELECHDVTREDLEPDLGRPAHDQLGFTPAQLKELCEVILLPSESTTGPKSPPPTSPPRGKVAAKKR